MKIDLKWDKPFRLRDGSKTNLIYSCPELPRIPRKPGVYVFARRFGGMIIPLYVGQAQRLRSRIEQQFKSNVQLMRGLENAPNGRRILLVGRVSLHRGQQQAKVLDIIESALIKNALAQGHDLLNQHGTKTKVHAIVSKGNHASRQIAPLKMLVERRQGT
jgi:hypothetical protein